MKSFNQILNLFVFVLLLSTTVVTRLALSAPNDPLFSKLDASGSPYQWAPRRVGAESGYLTWKPQRQVIVALLDTGAPLNHPDLKDSMLRDATGAVIGFNALTGGSDVTDKYGYGSYAAGAIVAKTNNAVGLAGITGWNPSIANSDSYLKLMPIKVSENDTISDTYLASGIRWAADHGAQVIDISGRRSENLSYNATTDSAIQYAWSKGCLIVAAAGDRNSSAPNYPAAYANVLSVSGTTKDDVLSQFANFGSWVNIVAPSENILTTTYSNTYSGFTGTSMAAGLVAAEAAALFSQNPTLTNGEVKNLIISNVDAYHPDTEGNVIAAGAGRMNIYKALEAAGDGTPKLTDVSVPPSATSNGKIALGTVQIGGPAPVGGVLVSLSSSDTNIATVPSSVLILEGQKSASFPVQAGHPATQMSTTITATVGTTTVSTVETVAGPQILSVTIPRDIVSGQKVLGTITLDDVPAAITVGLTHNASGIITIPSSLSVPAGKTVVTFPITTKLVGRKYSVAINATYGFSTSQGIFYLNAYGLAGMDFDLSSVKGGQSIKITVTLNQSAPLALAIPVALTYSNKAILVSPPASITIPAGAKSKTFTLTTRAVTSTKTDDITAALVVTVKKTLTITP